MATVNKQSLREEFDTLKGEFERLSAEGKMPVESRALFKAMLMLFEVLMAVFMEKRTARDSRNSSIPSSQTARDETALTRAGTKGKGPPQNGERSGNTRTVEVVQVASVHQCDTCGDRLHRVLPAHRLAVQQDLAGLDRLHPEDRPRRPRRDW